MTNLNVSFRHVGLSTEFGEIPCICLCYSNKNEAVLSYSLIHNYIKSNDSSKNLKIEFVRQPNNQYSLLLEFRFSDQIYDTMIADIEAVYVEKILKQLKIFRYYIILAGYGDGEDFQMLPFEQYQFFKTDIIIDNNLIVGNDKCKFDWNSLLA